MIRVVKDSIASKADEIVMVEEQLSPDELAAFRAQGDRAKRNADWIDAHGAEVFAPNRGRYVCIAGCELFVADTVHAAVALAKAAHPEDNGRLLRYLSPVKGPRIYAHRRCAEPAINTPARP